MSEIKTNCYPSLTKNLCWKAGIDEEVVINYKHLDVEGVKRPTNITGYSGVLEVRVKDYDAIPVLSIAATTIDAEGKFIFSATDIQTQALLTNLRSNYYKYRVVIVNPSTLRKVVMEGDLEVSV